MKKRAQFELSFSMMFSIILIAVTIAIAFYAIYYFLNLSKCTQVSLFYKDFQERIDKAWSGSITQDTFQGTLPSSLQYVCFGDLKQNSNLMQYEKLRIYRGQQGNAFLYPPEKACKLQVVTISHVDTSALLPLTCFPITNGKVDIKFSKQPTDALVKIIKDTPVKECKSYGSCKNGESCPSGTSCSGLPAYGCFPEGCPTPICLSSTTLISTPSGNIPVKELEEGMLVYSTNEKGEKIVSKIIKTAKTPAINHTIVHIILKDKRELFVSAPHPTADKRLFNQLKQGDVLDNSTIILYEKIPYDDNFTYDILPDSDTGNYWADNILISSTLK